MDKFYSYLIEKYNMPKLAESCVGKKIVEVISGDSCDRSNMYLLFDDNTVFIYQSEIWTDVISTKPLREIDEQYFYDMDQRFPGVAAELVQQHRKTFEDKQNEAEHRMYLKLKEKFEK